MPSGAGRRAFKIIWENSKKDLHWLVFWSNIIERFDAGFLHRSSSEKDFEKLKKSP